MSNSKPRRPTHYNYPPPIRIEAPIEEQRYKKTAENNPVVAGYTLELLSTLVTSFQFVQRALWKNADFGNLKDLKVIDKYVACFDPCVIPLHPDPDESSADVEVVNAPIDTAYYTSADYVKLYAARKTTPTKVAQKLLELVQSAAHKDAIVQVLPDKVIAAAEESTKRYAAGKPLGPLDGVPIVVKDEMDVHGYQKTFGTKKIWDEGHGETTWCVKKLEEAGCIIIAKTNLHECGSDTTNCNPVKGTPRNPHNRGYYTGGSSGGSAYCVSAGLVPIAVGADGGGSIRIPSNYCGNYGIKPSHGRLSGRPSPGLSRSNGVLGPICGTIEDLKLAYRVMSQPDPEEQSSALFPAPRSLEAPLLVSRAKKIGLWKAWFEDCDEAVRVLNDNAVQQLAKAGYEIVYLDPIPYMSDARKAHGLSITADMAVFCKGDVSKLNAPNRVLFSVASQTGVSDLFAANKVRAMMMSHFASIWQEHPGLIVVSPVTPAVGPKIDEAHLKYGVSDTNQSLRSMQYVFLANLIGTPAVNSIVGYDSESSMPISLMGMSEWGKDEDLLAFSADVAKVIGFQRRRPVGWVDVLTE